MDRDVIEMIRSMKADLSLAEGQVAATVLADPQFTIGATVAELATRAQVSQASVVRFSRALGFNGVPPCASNWPRSCRVGPSNWNAPTSQRARSMPPTPWRTW